jgi:centrin-1
MSKAKNTQLAKVQPPAPAKSGFDAKQWAKNGVSEEEVTAAKTAFDLFDSDQGGSVDIKGNSWVISELKAAMTSLGFEAKSLAIFTMLADLDTDGNGTIDFGEWLTLMTKRTTDKDSRANINKIFMLYDDERTGFISVKNLRRVANDLGENVPEEELEELIKRADTDGDGLVSEEEFYTILTRKVKDRIKWSCTIISSILITYPFNSRCNTSRTKDYIY